METTLQGVVTDVIYRNKDSVKFSLKTNDGINVKVVCNFFYMVQASDKVFIDKAVEIDAGVYKCITQPFTSIPEEKDKILEYFYKVLRGTGFGVISASKLYSQLDEQATILSKQFVPFLNELAAKYTDTYDKNLLQFVTGEDTTNSLKKKVVNNAQASKLLTDWHNKRSLRKLYLLGLTRTEILAAGVPLDALFVICMTNPYRIASIDYNKCDKILSSVRREVNDVSKLCGKINRYVYSQTMNGGNSCITEQSICNSFPFYNSVTEKLFTEYFLVKRDDKVYIEKSYSIETDVVRFVEYALSFNKKEEDVPSGPRLDRNFYDCKTLTEEQKNAIDGALSNKMSIVTGGAGTGKSEIIKEICKNLALRDRSYEVVAFTGKAVAKLHSVMGNTNAVTIDRLILEIKKQSKKVPLHIIIDEASMVTIELFHRLLKAIEEKPVTITFIGDTNQLPPIGYGNVMRELMLSQKIPIYTLTKNQRIIVAKDGEKTILENANALIEPTRNFKNPVKFKEGNGFYIIPGKIPTVHHIVTALKNSGVDCNDILLLSPYRAYLDELNTTVQEVYLEDSFKFEQKIPTGYRVWKVGDRVMMNRNNYDINVMNGETGYVMEIDNDGLKVKFEDIIHTFEFDDTIIKVVDKDDNEDDSKKFKEDDDKDPLLSSDLVHSFAVSIHKSQGSEADYIILYLEEKTQNSNFLNINLLYTAITRARKTIYIVGEESVLERISITPLSHKIDGLAERLKEL